MQTDWKRRRRHHHRVVANGNSFNPPLLACDSFVSKISHSNNRITSASVSAYNDSRDWSILPTDVLLVILGRLPVRDYLRFGAVCVSWNRAAATRLVSPAPPLPWLMADPIAHGASLFRAMLNPFSGKEECRIKLPTHRHYINSTSDGYIVYSDKNRELLMMNPLTRSRICCLPSTATLPANPNDGHCHIMKASLLRRLYTTAVAVACYSGRDYQLACSSPGDRRWTLLANSPYIFSMVFHKECLYVLHQRLGTSIWDFRGGRPPRPMPTLAPIAIDRRVFHVFLVESSTGDNLFQIQATCYGDHMIFKLQHHPSTATPYWCRVTGLSGDDALMLSLNQAVCVSSRDFPVLRRNCIYSTLRWIPPLAIGCKRNFSAQDTPLRMYSLDDRTMEPLPLGRYNEENIMDWFTPSI